MPENGHLTAVEFPHTRIVWGKTYIGWQLRGQKGHTEKAANMASYFDWEVTKYDHDYPILVPPPLLTYTDLFAPLATDFLLVDQLPLVNLEQKPKYTRQRRGRRRKNNRPCSQPERKRSPLFGGKICYN